jgi:hypothetical protein
MMTIFHIIEIWSSQFFNNMKNRRGEEDMKGFVIAASDKKTKAV